MLSKENRDAYWASMGALPFQHSESESATHSSAGLLARCLAQIIDLLFCAGLFFALWQLARLAGTDSGSVTSLFEALILRRGVYPIEHSTNVVYLTVLGTTLYFYFVLVPHSFGCTWGMRLLGLRFLSHRKNGKLSQEQLLVREILMKGILGVLTKGIALALPLFRKDGRSLGDLVSQTSVIKVRALSQSRRRHLNTA